MKKIIVSVISLIMAAVLLAGCGSKLKAFNYDMTEYVTLGKYKGLEIDKNSEEFKNALQTYFENDVAQNELYSQRKEGTVANGDIAGISYKGTKVSDGKVFTGSTDGTSNGYEDYELNIGSGQFIDNFEEQLIGANVGSEVEVNVTFPTNYGVEELNGQEAKFSVKINYINDLPEKNDDFAKKLKFDNLEAYDKDLQDRVIEDMILDKLFSAKDIVIKSYPDKEKANYDKLYEEFVASAKQQADTYNAQNSTSFTADDVLYQVYGLTSETLKQYYQNTLKQETIMYAIFKAENLSYSEQQYNKVIEDMAAAQGVTVEEVKSGMQDWAIEATVVAQIVTDFLIENASIK